MKTLMKILALVMAMAMVAGCLAACGGDANTTEPEATTAPTNPTEPSETDPTDPEPSEPVDDGKVEYKVYVKDADGNPVAGVLVQICKEGSTCFTPSRTNDDGVATWKLDEASDYYGTVSSLEEGMPKVYFENGFEVTLTYNPPVA